MNQDYITYGVVAVAMAIVVYRLTRLFFGAKKSSACGGNCGCAAKKEFTKKAIVK